VAVERKKKRKNKKVDPTTIPVVREQAAGADLGSTEHWVAAPPDPDGTPNVRTFGTTTKQIEEMASWLRERGVASIAMESTSVYWIPVFEILEQRGLEVVLVNARHLHSVPGRKTDMLDCQWIQRLHSCGLLRGSFRPGAAITKIRALRRQQGNLIEERVRAVQWMQKALDQMNVLVHRAVTNLTGATGLRIVRAIVGGERAPAELAALRDRNCRKSASQIAEFLTGTWHEEHLFNLAMALEHYDHLERQIASYDARIADEIRALQPPERAEARIAPHPSKSKDAAMRRRGEQPLREELWRFSGLDLTSIDGISPSAALTIVTEIGIDITAFPTEKHFVSWLRLSPRLAMSAGKPIRKKPNGMGSNRIAGVLRLAAMSLSRSKTALGASYRQVAFRKGARTAIFATARRLATLVYRLLRHGQSYIDIGEQAYQERFRRRRFQSLTNSARDLGYTLVPASEPFPPPEAVSS